MVARAWLAALAETWWAADRALTRAAPRFRARRRRQPDDRTGARRRARWRRWTSVVERGDYDAATEGQRPLAATYRIAPTPHLSLEPPRSPCASPATGWKCGQRRIRRTSRAPRRRRRPGSGRKQVTLYPMPVGDGRRRHDRHRTDRDRDRRGARRWRAGVADAARRDGAEPGRAPPAAGGADQRACRRRGRTGQLAWPLRRGRGARCRAGAGAGQRRSRPSARGACAALCRGGAADRGRDGRSADPHRLYARRTTRR